MYEVSNIVHVNRFSILNVSMYCKLQVTKEIMIAYCDSNNNMGSNLFLSF